MPQANICERPMLRIQPHIGLLVEFKLGKPLKNKAITRRFVDSRRFRQPPGHAFSYIHSGASYRIFTGGEK